MDKTCINCYHFNPCVKCSENNVGVCDFGDCNLHKHRAVDGNCTVCDDYCEIFNNGTLFGELECKEDRFDSLMSDAQVDIADPKYKVADEPKWAVGVDLSSMSDCSIEMDYTIDADGKLIPHSLSITRPEV